MTNASDSRERKPASVAVHAGGRQQLGAAIPTVSPLHFSTSFVFEDADDLDAVFDNPEDSYCYGRFGNPTVRALEQALAALEQTDAAIAYPSGMSAVNGVIQAFAGPGDHVIVSRDVYGATLTLLETQFAAIGVVPHVVDIVDLDAVRAEIEEHKPTLVMAETISNPLLKVADIRGLADIAHEHGALLSIDNTFASPILVRPCDLGADVVLHSTTKFIAGHGDVTGGVVCGSKETVTRLRNLARINGAVPGPMDAWLTQRGVKTLGLRMRAQCANARKLVEWLQAQNFVEHVYYPGLDAPVPSGQFIGDDVCALVSFDVRGFGRDEAFRYLESLEMIEPATTLGDVGTLTLYPAMSSHRGLGAEKRAEWGIGDGLLRVSVGIEDSDDIIADLDQALRAALEGDVTA